MRIIEYKAYKYITEDGKEFDDERKAREHEYELFNKLDSKLNKKEYYSPISSIDLDKTNDLVMMSNGKLNDGNCPNCSIKLKLTSKSLRDHSISYWSTYECSECKYRLEVFTP